MRRWPADPRSVGVTAASGFLVAALGLVAWGCAGSPPPEAPAPAEPAAASERRTDLPVSPRTTDPAGRARAEPDRPITELIDSEPLIRVGVDVGARSAVIMSTGGLRVRDGGTGEPLLSTGEEILRFELVEGGAALTEPAIPIGGPRSSYLVEPIDRSARVILAEKPYRGSAVVRADAERGLIVINRLGLEAYLLGVVPAEIGRRTEEEFAAVRAQAVAARTYTIANLGRRDSLGFDVFGTVEDQVYGGVEVERAEVERAIRETRGEILTFDGGPVMALYHSTCGGRTATRHEVWGEPDLPYLRSVRDRRERGGDYCAISPRYRWRESWSPSELNGLVRAELAGWLGVSPESIGRISGIRVLSRTVDDRVDQLEIEASRGRYVLEKNDIRFVLRPSEGRILGSTDFVVRQGRTDEGAVVVEGRGFGHGIGMCQWGAIGRARAGESYREILAAYYRSAVVERLY